MIHFKKEKLTFRIGIIIIVIEIIMMASRVSQLVMNPPAMQET